jgi:hypothetical protein
VDTFFTLVRAVTDDDPDAVRRAIADVPDVELRHPGTSGYTALHVAAHRHALGALEVLLEAGANVDATDDAGNTPLHYATYRDVFYPEDERVVAALLAAGADPAGAASRHPSHFEGESAVAVYDDREILFSLGSDGLLSAPRRPWRETYYPANAGYFDHVFAELPDALREPVTLTWLVGYVPRGSGGQPVQLSAMRLFELPGPPARLPNGVLEDDRYGTLGPTEQLPLDDVLAAARGGRFADPETATLAFAILHAARQDDIA